MKKIMMIIAALMALTLGASATHSYDGCQTCVDGADGADGYTPIKGVDYFDGADGAKGDKGDKGDAGVGIDGIDGIDGINGINGTTTLEIETTYTFDETQLDELKSSYQKEADRILDEMDALAEQGLNLSAGANAVSAIDFNADHKGHSIGFGYGFGNTWKDYRGGAGALGYQYAWTHKEYDVSVVVKSWAGKQSTYGVGFGGVIGF